MALRRCPFLPLLTLAVGLVFGCGGPRPYPVSGKLVYDDGAAAADLAGAEVIFSSQELHVSSSGSVNAEGDLLYRGATFDTYLHDE